MIIHPEIQGEHYLYGVYTPYLNPVVFPGISMGKSMKIYVAVTECKVQPVGRPPLFVAECAPDIIPVGSYIFFDEYGYLGFVDHKPKAMELL